MPPQVPAVKAAVVNDDGEILVLKRSPDETHLQGLWDLPGGSVDHGEHPQAALQREVDEEAGIAVTPVEPVRTWSFMHDDGTHRVGVTVRCTAETTDVAVGDEHTAHRWIGPEDVGDVEMYDDMKETLRQVFTDRDRRPAGSKLVRDRVPAMIRGDDAEPVTERVGDEQVLPYLADKLVEEAQEFAADRAPEELADLYAVLDRYLQLADIDEDHVRRLQQEKAAQNGRFTHNIVLHDVQQD